MTQLTVSFVLKSLVCLLVSPAATGSFDPDSDPVFQKVLHSNAGLKSYTAHVDVETRLFFGRFILHGTLYNLGGDSKVVFDHVPFLAQGALKRQPSIEAPARWAARYAIARTAQTTDSTTYRLVPHDSSSLREVDVAVQNTTGLITEFVWSTADGMTITSDQTYESVDGYQLVASTVSETRGGGLSTHSTTSFTNYSLNETIPDSVISPAR